VLFDHSVDSSNFILSSKAKSTKHDSKDINKSIVINNKKNAIIALGILFAYEAVCILAYIMVDHNLDNTDFKEDNIWEHNY
jgi:hypothetical protein